jgi:hypothetical protein
MKINEIIEKLCSHEITKNQAIEAISIIVNGFRNNNAIEFTVESVGFTIESKHGILELKLPYQYSRIENKVKKGDKIDVILLP